MRWVAMLSCGDIVGGEGRHLPTTDWECAAICPGCVERISKNKAALFHNPCRPFVLVWRLP